MSFLVPVEIDQLIHTRVYTLVILRSDNIRFPIYADTNVGKSLQMYLSGIAAPRPLTYDLVNMVLQSLDVVIKQAVINDVQDTVYFARLFLEQKQQKQDRIIELDARPSDCISLAVMNNLPLYCTKNVLEKAFRIA